MWRIRRYADDVKDVKKKTMPVKQPPALSETPPGVVADDASAPRVTEGPSSGAVGAPDVEYVHYYNAVVPITKRQTPSAPPAAAEPDDDDLDL